MYDIGIGKEFSKYVSNIDNIVLNCTFDIIFLI